MKKNRKSIIRVIIQLVFFTLIGLIAVNHGLVESGGGITWLSSASLHAICPFGGVVSLYQLFTVGTFVKKIHSATIVLMFIVLFLSVLLGPVFCGWICPLGSFQEFISKIGKKVFGSSYNHFLSKKLDKYLRYLRYAVLVWVIFMTAKSAELIFQSYDPYYTLFNFWTDEVAITGFVVLAVVIVSTIFIERPWCKYACPYGALLGVTNKLSIFKIKREKNKCISCSICDGACPMNIEVSSLEVVKDTQCIRCMKCTSENSCPVEETVIIIV